MIGASAQTKETGGSPEGLHPRKKLKVDHRRIGEKATDCPDLSKLSEVELATAINGAHQQSEVGIHNARKHAETALTGALAAGAYLQEVHRREGKSGWGNWVKGHCPQLPISTAYRYMDLARKFPRMRKPEEIRNLRQAYIAAGILLETPAKAEAKQAPALHHVEPATVTDLVARVKSTWAFLGVEFENADFVAMEETQRQRLQQEISVLLNGLTEIMAQLTRDNPASPGTNSSTVDGKASQ